MVSVADAGVLRLLASESVGADPLTNVLVRVERWRAPRPGWLGSPLVSGLTGFRVEPRTSGVEVELVFGEPCDPGIALAAVVRVLTPISRGAAQPLLTWCPCVRTEGRLIENLRDISSLAADAHLRRTDVALAAVDEAVGDIAERIVRVDGDSWSGHSVFLDPAIHRPLGRRSDSGGDVVAASSLNLPESLTLGDVRALRAVRAVIDSGALTDKQRAQVQATGVLVVTDPATLPEADDYVGWQVASVASRNDALRSFSPLPAVMDWPTVSLVIATHRPERLAHALAQARSQNYPYLQIVVAVHSDEPVDVRALMDGWTGDWVAIGVPRHLSLGQVLHEASMRAEGDLISKMDDDDYYSPDHIWDLVLARMYSGAEVVGKALDHIYLAEQDLTVFRPTYGAEKYADFVAGGTILISAGDLAQVGGWRPVPRSVDRALLDAVIRSGGLIYRTHGVGYTYVRHGSSNTSQVSDEHFLTKNVSSRQGLVTWDSHHHE